MEETVLRTNTQTAYQAGWYDDLTAGTDEYWEYCAVLDGRETELCEALDGQVFHRDDPFWHTYFPPNHFNCRSTVISLSADEVDISKVMKGEDYLKEYAKNNPDCDLSQGKGFENSPGKGLDEFLTQKCSALGLPLPDPNQLLLPDKHFKDENKLKEHLKKYNNIHIDIKGNKTIIEKHLPQLEALSIQYPKTIFNFKGMDIRIVNEMIPNLYKLMQGHPKGTFDKFLYIGLNGRSVIPKGWDKNLNGKNYTINGVFLHNRIGEYAILLNNKKHANYDKWLNEVLKSQTPSNHNGRYDADIKEKSGNNPTTLRTFYHEWGHLLDYVYGEQRGIVYNNLSDGKKILDRFKYTKYFVYDYVKSEWVGATPISRYSGADRGEFIAEAFADVMSSGFLNANEHSQYIYRVMYHKMKNKGYKGIFPL